MYGGKYYDNRTHKQLVHTYSRVNYLDSQIFDIQTHNLRQSRRIASRTIKAQEGLQRAKLKSEQLSNSLKQSRIKKQQRDKTFMVEMEIAQGNCLEKEKTAWAEYSAQKATEKEQYYREQIYLSDKLKSNSTKAASRFTSVRRWD